MVGRPVGVVLVPAPALRRLVEGREGAIVVVAVVAGRVRVDVTGRGRLVVVVVVVVVGRVRVDVVGRVWVAVVMGAVVVMVGGGGAVVVGVVVVMGAVPVPATGGSVNASKASFTLTG